jgi:hypothetical protein
MRNFPCAAAAALSLLLAAWPAGACLMIAPLNLDDIKYASVVVVGRIVDYEIVLASPHRQFHKEMSERPDLSPEARQEHLEMSSRQKSLMGDYARFKILVDEVLAGQVPDVIYATWNNSTFGISKQMEEGPFLIGLHAPGSRTPPFRGPSATVTPPPEPETLMVLQAPCAPPFMFESTSDRARKIREMLGDGAE